MKKQFKKGDKVKIVRQSESLSNQYYVEKNGFKIGDTVTCSGDDYNDYFGIEEKPIRIHSSALELVVDNPKSLYQNPDGTYNLKDVPTGTPFTAKINGIACEGKVYRASNGFVYLCQDKKKGGETDQNLGYKYTWCISTSGIRLDCVCTRDLIFYPIEPAFNPQPGDDVEWFLTKEATWHEGKFIATVQLQDTYSHFVAIGDIEYTDMLSQAGGLSVACKKIRPIQPKERTHYVNIYTTGAGKIKTKGYPTKEIAEQMADDFKKYRVLFQVIAYPITFKLQQ